jgi:hypothetical protein
MLFAKWLASEFVSTPFAFKQQLGTPLLPLLATCVRLMDVQDGCPGETCSLSLHAPSEDFSPQEIRVLTFTGCVCFFTPGKQKTPFSHYL